MIPTPANQQLLDAGLTRAPDQAKAHFAMLVNQSENGKRTEHPEDFEIPGAGLLKASPDASTQFGDSGYLEGYSGDRNVM